MYQMISTKRALAALAILAPALIVAASIHAAAQTPPPAPAAQTAPVAPSTTVVAKVNGKDITEADMQMAGAELANDLAQLPADVKRRALLEYLVDNMLFADEAEATKLGDTPEFQSQMTYLRRRLLRDQFFEKTLKSQLDEAEAKKIYDARVAEMKPEDEFAARHILVDNEAKAKELRAKIVAGGDFAEVAKANTLDTGTKEQGGMLPFFVKGQMVPEFETAALKLQKGEVSEPVKTNFGWHIIKLEDRRRKPPPDLESVKNTILNSLAVRKAQQTAGEMRTKAKLEYIDTEIKAQVEAEAKKAAEAAKAPPAGAAPAAPPAAAPGAAPAAAPAAKEEPKAAPK
jgi:peptidyl-prolyl cis-trans isomerase C